MLTRRDFLKLAALSGLSLGTVAFDEKFPDKGKRKPIGLGRVTASKIHVYRDPSLNSERIGARYRDELIHLLEEIISPDGPQHNPLWLRIHGGYAHSGYLQAVQTRLNPPPTWIPRSGRVFELTVPLSQSYRYTRSSGWSKLYRLYYQSLHWVTAIVEGPDGDPWAQIMDERLRIHYYVPATHLQPIPIADFQPISPDVPPEDKRILVSLSDQSLTAFEGDQAVFRTRISSGIPSKGPSPNGIPTTTPSGRFIISRKMPVRHMGSGDITNDINAYELPGVPWVSYFVATGVAFHGTYWHNNFGRPMSHGCVNMRPQDAHWLYRWSGPRSSATDWYLQGRGAIVDVIA